VTGPIEISEEIFGDVAVLHLKGRLTIGDPCELFNGCISRLLSAGQKKILLDIGELGHIDSSGLSILARSSIVVTRRKGNLKLCNATGRVNDALVVTRLSEYFDVFPSIKEGLRAFSAAPLYCLCPVCGSRSEPPAHNQVSLYWPPQTCSHCDSQFIVTNEMPVQNRTVLAKIKIVTYGKENECLEVLPGPPVSLCVVGRLDLFSSRAVEIALRAIPVPRLAAIDLGRTTEISEGGRDALLTLLASTEKGDRVVVSLEGLSPDRLSPLFQSVQVLSFDEKCRIWRFGSCPQEIHLARQHRQSLRE